jgi:hypothetical protein
VSKPIDCGLGGNLWRISDWNVDDEVFLSRIGGFGGTGPCACGVGGSN